MSFKVAHIESVVKRALVPGRQLLCVSGGADSMALLHACCRIGVDCVVVHCDFHLRGSESERDRRFVAWVCKLLRVECVQLHFDVQSYVKAHGVSMEMACRELRYAEFRRLKQDMGCVRIVTAHNRDDNDETMLLNLFRGTGVAGLCGMEEDTGEITRPLLEVSRTEIEVYLSAIHAKYIVDSSNLSVDYRRNFIRRELLPMIATRWPGINKSLARTRRNMKEVRRVCSLLILEQKVESKDFLSAQVYEEALSRPLLLRNWLACHGVSPTQIDEMSAGLRPGCTWPLKDCVVAMQRDGLHVLPFREKSLFEFDSKQAALTESLMKEIRSRRDNMVLYYTGDETLTFRNAAKGDRIASFGMRGSKLVSDLLREAGVPVPLRSGYPVAVDSRDRVIWVPGVRRSRYLCVRPEEDEVVKIIRCKKLRHEHGDMENKC